MIDTSIRKYFMLVNGIETKLGNLENWHYRMEDEIELRTPWQANVFPYHSPVWIAWARRRKLEEALMAKMLKRSSPGQRMVMAAHSDGCRITLNMLKKMAAIVKQQKAGESNVQPEMKIHELYLIASAADDDCETNGINEAIETGLVEKIMIMKSPDDKALKKAKFFHFMNKIYSKWGYGYMGLTGLKNRVETLPPGVEVREKEFPGYDHGTYFDTDHWDETVSYVMGG